MQNRFSLPDYLDRVIGKDFKPEVTLTSLSHIILRHLYYLRYQNTVLYNEGLKPVADRIVPDLDIDTLYQQLILDQQPGYCFQNSELLFAVLTACGFATHRHIASVIHKPLPLLTAEEFIATHELLTVTLDEVQYVIDTAFGHNSFRAPVKLEAGEHTIGSDVYYLTNEDDKWRLDLKLGTDDKWFCLYQFSPKPIDRDEIVAAHQKLYLSENHISIRDDFFKAASVSESKRRVIAFFKSGTGFYKSFRLDGQCKERRLQNIDEAKELAIRKFKI